MEDRQGARYCVACEEVDNVRSSDAQQAQVTANVAQIALGASRTSRFYSHFVPSEDSVNLYRVAGGAQLSAEGTGSVDVGIPIKAENVERRSFSDKATAASSFTAPVRGCRKCRL